MNTLEINKLANSNANISRVFGGCLANDQLANLLQLQSNQLPKAFVINLCDSTIVGEASIGCHWTALYLHNNHHVDYFDSAGDPSFLSNKYIWQFIQKQLVRDVTFVSKQIQSLTSNKCGMFCLTFLNALASGISYDEFVSVFDLNNLDRNDKIVEQLFTENFFKARINCKCVNSLKKKKRKKQRFDQSE